MGQYTRAVTPPTSLSVTETQLRLCFCPLKWDVGWSLIVLGLFSSINMPVKTRGWPTWLVFIVAGQLGRPLTCGTRCVFAKGFAGLGIVELAEPCVFSLGCGLGRSFHLVLILFFIRY